MNNKPYCINEYGSFARDKHIAGYEYLPAKVFDALKLFVLENAAIGNDGTELMGLSVRKNVGEVLTAKNYVGVIALNDGSVIEILPKIQGQHTDGDTKKLLVNMLCTLRNSPFKAMQLTNVNVDKLPLFEIFIRMFISEAYSVVKKGLKSGYEVVDDNLTVCKGKLNFNQQIKQNFAHKERFSLSYDEFNNNRPENKLIKSTIQYLFRCSKSSKNRADIKILLNVFENIDESVSIESDFAACTNDRNSRYYNTLLMWCRVFLKGKSFTSFAGSEIAYALLFPMEKLFESYVAVHLKKQLNPDDYSVSIQNTGKHLFETPKKFSLRPDIVVTCKSDNAVFVLDTKWKLLNNNSAVNYGIAQSDMYQMYAYQKKYSATNVTLLYPKTENVSDDRNIEFVSDDAKVRVKFVDLFNINNLSDILC